MNCPLMSQSVPQKHHGSEVIWIDCIEGSCRWWFEKNCIVFGIVSGLKDLATEIERARHSASSEVARGESL